MSIFFENSQQAVTQVLFAAQAKERLEALYIEHPHNAEAIMYHFAQWYLDTVQDNASIQDYGDEDFQQAMHYIIEIYNDEWSDVHTNTQKIENMSRCLTHGVDEAKEALEDNTFIPAESFEYYQAACAELINFFETEHPELNMSFDLRFKAAIASESLEAFCAPDDTPSNHFTQAGM